ncbi:DUF5133 domain-containing protein [Streptomyces sp. NPDC090022]|uniref:DUF5133 domain-containing protein n=1 Tax=Streptomyces sp. NPDC090022 TaxID=3365920 RepID=UPI00382CFC91
MTFPVTPPATARSGAPQAPAGADAGVAMAVGMLMALTPCTARTARRILTAAAAATGAGVQDVARVLVTRTPGAPVPGRVGRALRAAVEGARARNSVTGGPDVAEPALQLSPDRGYAGEVLGRYLDCRAAAEGGGEQALQELDDAAYTLCVLMARRTPAEAVRAAREYLATS